MCEKKINRRRFLEETALGCAAAAFIPSRFVHANETTKLQTPVWNKLPCWRGFNLLEKFNSRNERFREDDFKNIHDLGFNFVRLPMDYRVWTVGKEKRQFKEETLSEIDEAVRYGRKYGVHVCLNFHRAPGWTVANPPEEPSLWKDKATQELCAWHWATFAKRYKDIPNENISFNLLNEPATVNDNAYYNAMKTIIDAIRVESPDRLIICDGTNYGTTPFMRLKELKVAQSTRGYKPMQISHYKASWVSGTDKIPVPTWPLNVVNGYLYVPSKKEVDEVARRPMVIKGPFPEVVQLRLRVDIVSTKSVLVVRADGREIYKKEFLPQGGKGEWSKAVYKAEWKTWQNIYDKDYTLEIPAGTNTIEIQNVAGDWLLLSELEFKSVKGGCKIACNSSWAGPVPVFQWNASEGKIKTIDGEIYDRKWLEETSIAPWKEWEKSGGGVIVGEFGAYNKTPHDVVLRWMEDMLLNWKKAGWGWALWNFRGSIGVIDSERRDVNYQEWRGLAVDRKMMDLLQQY